MTLPKILGTAFAVPRRSPQTIEFDAWQLRQFLGLGALEKICPFAVVTRLSKVHGETFGVVIRCEPDGHIGIEGWLEIDPPVISLEARVFEDARSGGALGRDVVLHELAHLLLHASALRTYRNRSLRGGDLKPGKHFTEQSEWQAIRLSSAFAMPLPMVAAMRSVDALAEASGMPRKRASYRLGRVVRSDASDGQQLRLFNR
ncbi:MAG: ImmA/IrrE family metallo-endopeptidase [Pseudomonadota bacterium]